MTAPLIPPVGDAKTVTSSEPTTNMGTNMECESPTNSPLRPEWKGGGGAGVSNDRCMTILDVR